MYGCKFTKNIEMCEEISGKNDKIRKKYVYLHK
jgi:hypothetical protein